MPLLAVASTVSSSVNPVALKKPSVASAASCPAAVSRSRRCWSLCSSARPGRRSRCLASPTNAIGVPGDRGAAAARERQDVDLVAHLVLAAGDDGLPDRADGQACLSGSVAGDPLGGECLEMGAEDLGFCGVLCLGPDLARPASFQVGQVRFDD